MHEYCSKRELNTIRCNHCNSSIKTRRYYRVFDWQSERRKSTKRSIMDPIKENQPKSPKKSNETSGVTTLGKLCGIILKLPEFSKEREDLLKLVLPKFEEKVGSKPLMRVLMSHISKNYHRGVAECFLKGLSLDCQLTKDNETPLLYAIAKDKVDIVRLLITMGANLEALDSVRILFKFFFVE